MTVICNFLVNLYQRKSRKVYKYYPRNLYKRTIQVIDPGSFCQRQRRLKKPNQCEKEKETYTVLKKNFLTCKFYDITLLRPMIERENKRFLIKPTKKPVNKRTTEET